SFPTRGSSDLMTGCLIFHAITIPDPEPRYLVPVVAPTILFLAAGIREISQWLRCRQVLLASFAIAYAAGSFQLVGTPHQGYAEVASAITREVNPGREVILTSGGAESEGMAVSEIASQDKRPGHYVLRG